ncbi:hypothetical protein TNCV_4473191 [Trichonephila clavipes]|uniref:Uncharacterized protein n=1 Tax=Trichonephila clavipes TaxID=2585209 RepID=A0A8X6SDS8_TRICX|nr:hypothetical protein TNCV_4473191 [Trichonephila clavipes]
MMTKITQKNDIIIFAHGYLGVNRDSKPVNPQYGLWQAVPISHIEGRTFDSLLTVFNFYYEGPALVERRIGLQPYGEVRPSVLKMVGASEIELHKNRVWFEKRID